MADEQIFSEEYGSKIENKPIDTTLTGLEKLLATNDGNNKTVNIRVSDLANFIAQSFNFQYFVGNINPTGNVYPSTSGQSIGAYWIVSGLLAPYTYTAGELAGETVDNNYQIVFSTTGLLLNTQTATVWGAIEGTLSEQADLVAEFEGKEDAFAFGLPFQVLATNATATGKEWTYAVLSAGDQVKTGTLTVDVLKTEKATPTDANDVVPLLFLTTNYLNKTGNQSVNGEITFNNVKITQVTPSAETDLVPLKYLQDNYQSSIKTLPWAEIVAIKTAGNMHVGQTYIVSDQGNEEILIDGKSPDGSFFFKRTGDDGVQTIFKVE